MSNIGGIKADEGKPALALIPPLGEVELGKAMSNGLKYGKWNYLDGIDATRLLSAAKRHINAFLRGEDYAPDSGVHHLGHAAASCLMVIDILARHPERDDRPQTSEEVEQEKRLTAAQLGNNQIFQQEFANSERDSRFANAVEHAMEKYKDVLEKLHDDPPANNQCAHVWVPHCFVGGNIGSISTGANMGEHCTQCGAVRA